MLLNSGRMLCTKGLCFNDDCGIDTINNHTTKAVEGLKPGISNCSSLASFWRVKPNRESLFLGNFVSKTSAFARLLAYYRD